MATNSRVHDAPNVPLAGMRAQPLQGRQLAVARRADARPLVQRRFVVVLDPSEHVDLSVASGAIGDRRHVHVATVDGRDLERLQVPKFARLFAGAVIPGHAVPVCPQERSERAVPCHFRRQLGVPFKRAPHAVGPPKPPRCPHDLAQAGLRGLWARYAQRAGNELQNERQRDKFVQLAKHVRRKVDD